MLTTVLCASIGCFTGLVFTLLTRSGGIKGAIFDALVGTAGGLLMAWFISPISENAPDPDSLNIAAVVGAVIGAFVLVAVAKAIRASEMRAGVALSSDSPFDKTERFPSVWDQTIEPYLKSTDEWVARCRARVLQLDAVLKTDEADALVWK